ncbi:MAG TPA: hypothetical protein PLD88_07010, partial [Candidatus Berkiella sp.]|nr:hypothetical protein [Candidatus Berkiella sp.]
ETSDKPLTFNKQLEENSPETVKNERSLYENRKTELQVKLNILKDDVEQRKQELMGAQGKKDQLERSLALVKKELALTKPLVSQGAVSEVDVLRLERTVNDLAGELEQTQ